VAEHESDDRRASGRGIERAAGTGIDDRDRAIDADLPSLALAEIGKRSVGHEAQDDGFRLSADLETDGSGSRAVVIGRRTADSQRAGAVFASDSESRLHDTREDENFFAVCVSLVRPRPRWKRSIAVSTLMSISLADAAFAGDACNASATIAHTCAECVRNEGTTSA
jgi:hypothetical protein